MRITFDLPPELESELSAEATRLNLSLSEYILRLLVAGRTTTNLPKTGAELIDYWQSEGVIGSRFDITDSQEYARNLRRESQTRRQL